MALQRGIVELVPYDSNWVKEYDKEKELLERVLKDYILEILLFIIPILSAILMILAIIANLKNNKRKVLIIKIILYSLMVILYICKM